MTPENRRKAFETWLCTQVGLESFNQFVFLHHFVLMFDESRHLLFWDQRACEQALFLIFGGNKEASAADALRRDVEKNDSLARNAQYQITNTEKRIEEIRLALGVSAAELATDVALVERIAVLVRAEESIIAKLDKLDESLRDNSLALADRAASVVALRDEYAKRFQQIVAAHADPADHPAVKASLDEGQCSICGTASPSILVHINRMLKEHRCPLCETPLGAIEQTATYADLRAIDERIGEAQEQLRIANAERSRLGAERETLLARISETRSQLRRFEKNNREAVASARNRGLTDGADQGRVSLEALALDVDQQKAKKAKLILDRDRKKADLRLLQGQLARRYTLAEAQFVPAFRALAEQFLGIPVTVRLKGSATKLSLVIEVAKSPRREEYQLSESQRFFVDIALRMALAQFASSDDMAAPFLVDTPEGALDIAYESQAGKMFAAFVKSGHQVVMTANVNSSELVLDLARSLSRTRPKLFRLERMTDWAAMSQVQRTGMPLFKKAYRDIEKALENKSG
jgi:DNA repair exonuclease SbcCD ATPase subunit